jgi:hypothetical protein
VENPGKVSLSGEKRLEVCSERKARRTARDDRVWMLRKILHNPWHNFFR